MAAVGDLRRGQGRPGCGTLLGVQDTTGRGEIGTSSFDEAGKQTRGLDLRLLDQLLELFHFPRVLVLHVQLLGAEHFAGAVIGRFDRFS